MNKFAFIATVALTAGTAFAADDVSQQLAEMRQQMAAQQAKIAALEKQVQEQQSAQQQDLAQIREDVSASLAHQGYAADQAAPGGIKLASNISALTLKGDLRLRYEMRDTDDGAGATQSRDRFRTRFRLGGVWKSDDESWEVGAGLATGGADGRSTNDTWSDGAVFETGDIRLDYGYASHKMGIATVTFGQQVNPFKGSFLMWDSDLRPTGATLKLADSGFFATLGAYDVFETWANNEADASLLAAQLGYSGKIAESLDGTLAVGFYNFNANSKALAAGATVPADYDYQIVDLYYELGAKLGDVKVTPFAHAWKNLGAEGTLGQNQLGSAALAAEDADMGWAAGVTAKYSAFSVGYAYGYVEADSFPAFLKDSDFGDGLSDTNVEGHRITLGYDVTKNFNVGLTALLLQDIDATERESNIYQLDFVYKF